MKKRAVGYCRISTLMQVDNTSLKDQEDKIRMYAKLQIGRASCRERV